MFTPHQSAYFAHWLTQSGRIENQVSRTIASARVDMIHLNIQLYDFTFLMLRECPDASIHLPSYSIR